MKLFHKILGIQSKTKSSNQPDSDSNTPKKDLKGFITALNTRGDDIKAKDVNELFKHIIEMNSEEVYIEFSIYLIDSTVLQEHIVKLLMTQSEIYDWVFNSVIEFPDKSSRKIYVELLSKADKEKTFSLLKKVIHSEDELKACYATESLIVFDDKKSVEILLQILQSGKEWLATTAGTVLKHLKHNIDLFDQLIQLARNNNPNIKKGALIAMTGINNKVSAEILVNYINDPDKSLRNTIKKGLRAMGECGVEALSKKIGYEEALKILNPQQHQNYILEQHNKHMNEVNKQMSDIKNLINKLKSLDIYKGTKWLKEKVFCGTYSYEFNYVVSENKIERKYAGNQYKIEHAARKLFDLWRNSTIKLKKNEEEVTIISKNLSFSSNKLIIQLKGKHNNYKNLKIEISVIRLENDNIFILKEYISAGSSLCSFK